MDNPQEFLPRFRPLFFLYALNEEQVLDITQRFEVIQCAPGDVLANTAPPPPPKPEGDEKKPDPPDLNAPYFYMLHRGRVTLHYPGPNLTTKQLTLVPGDYFGEDELFGAPLTSRIIADTPCMLLRLNHSEFEKLLADYPAFRMGLQLAHQTRRHYAAFKLPWLNPGETVYLIAQRHPLLLWQMMALPVIAIVIVLALAPFLWSLPIWTPTIAGVVIGVGLLITGGWAAWNYIDFHNDYYILTNMRVIYLEKIVGLYDSRQESVLTSVQSVTVDTDSSSARMLGLGDVVLQTFTGPLKMRAMAQPELLAKLVDEYRERSRRRAIEDELENRKRALEELLYPPLPKPKAAPAPRKKPSSFGVLGEYFDFQMRFERNGNITYRKHWYVLWEGIGGPSFLFLVNAALLGIALGGFIPIPMEVTLFIVFVAFIPIAVWWWYEYEDWKNDLYQITNDQLVDVYKKPLGKEERRVAQLDNILGLKYERPGLIGTLFNYGNVSATIPGGDFTFDGVFDPMGVHTDINRRMEEFKRRQKQAEAKSRRQEIIDWIAAYHALKEEHDKINPTKPPE